MIRYIFATRSRPYASRCAYTLVELVVSMVSSLLLIGGLAATLYISSSALNTTNNGNRQSRIAGEILGEMMADLHHALTFSERTATAVTFTVPDRNGDRTPETIRYAWSGTLGDPLTYQFNKGPIATLASNVQQFQFTTNTRAMAGRNVSAGPPSTAVFYEEFTEAKAGNDTTSLAIPRPPGTMEGDLLIVAIVHDGLLNGISAPSGNWTELLVGTSGNRVSIGVWWTIADNNRPATYDLGWGGNQQAYGWIMRFTGHDPTNPINVTASSADVSATATAPAVVTTLDNCMILRIGGFDHDKFDLVVPGLAGHTIITADISGSGGGSASGGAGYMTLATAGSSGNTSFTQNSSEDYVTLTIAIAPEQP